MRGRLRDIIPAGSRCVVSLELETRAEGLNGLIGKDLSAELKEYRERRSLDANSYFHVLVSKIAEKMGSSATEIKNHLIADYGQINRLPDGALDWSVKPESFDWTKSVETHYQPTDRYVDDGGKRYPIFIVMRGSHTYDTREMAHLIDGTVNEAKGLGIETATPDEMVKMMVAWEKKYGAKRQSVQG